MWLLFSVPHRVHLPDLDVNIVADYWLDEGGLLDLPGRKTPKTYWKKNDLTGLSRRTYLVRTSDYKASLLGTPNPRSPELIFTYAAQRLPKYVWVVELTRSPPSANPKRWTVDGEMIIDPTISPRDLQNALLITRIDKSSVVREWMGGVRHEGTPLLADQRAWYYYDNLDGSPHSRFEPTQRQRE
jgi:hypothetical protein